MWDITEGKVYTGMGRGLPVAPFCMYSLMKRK